MLSSPTVAARSLDELLAYHDSDFVHCAYITLLGRVPDIEGIRYYLGRLRSGYEKMSIIQQLVSSQEGMKYKANVAHLNSTLRYYRISKWPLIGYVFSLFIQSSIKISSKKHLNIIENKIYQIEKESNLRLAKLEESINSLQYALETGSYSIDNSKIVSSKQEVEIKFVSPFPNRDEQINSPLESFIHNISKAGK